MNSILGLGIILLCGLAAEKAINRLRIPAITSFIVTGILIGPAVLGLVGPELLAASDMMSYIVLGFIAFHIGSNFEYKSFKRIGPMVIGISLSETAMTWLLVTLGVHYGANQPFYIAIIYGSVAAATAPAAIMMVIRQYRTRGTFTDVLLGVVAIDDAWGIIVYSFSLIVAMGIHNGSFADVGAVRGILFHVTSDIFFSFLIGAAAAVALKQIGGYIRRRGDTLTLTLGSLLLTVGIARYLDVSPILTNMFFGAVLVNIDDTAYRYFDFLKTVDWPFYIIFYVLVGVNLRVELLSTLGLTAAVYMAFRIAGKTTGAYIGGRISGAEKKIRRYMGIALMPQAGVALGLALSARAHFPSVGEAMFTAITVSTILYGIFGPLAAKYALGKAGDIRQNHSR